MTGKVALSGKYQAYPKYKNSEIEWVGDIPEHWVVAELKRYSRVQGGYAFSSDSFVDSGIPVIRIGDIKQDGTISLESCKYIQDEVSTQYKDFEVRSGDLLMAMTGATIGKAGWFKGSQRALLNQRVGSFKCNKSFLNYKFFWYVLNSLGYQEYIRITAFGGAQPNISDTGMVSYQSAIPDLIEQEKIASFLDHETAKIDTLIDKQQQLIQLLKEKRQAVISHAVTKGLNPNAPMRDSGVEWLGEVPEHWVTTRLKYMKSQVSNAFVDGPFGSNLKSEHFLENGDVYVIESNFATTGLLDTSKLKKISNNHYETIKRSSAKGGDIIIAKIGARYGSSSILPEVDKKAVVSGNSLKLTVNENLLNVEYANELLRVLKQNDAMDDGVNVTAQPALSLGGLNNLPFLKLPIEEQKKIVGYIKSAKNKYDELIFNVDRFIDLAKERRTALISAAVTGKIDVRHHAIKAN